MQAEILMIGTELLLGQIDDTNATHLARELAENGIDLFQKTTVGDNRVRIINALDAALDRSDVVLCSGGLGPTEDDITRDCLGELLNRPLEFREDLYNAVLERFKHIPIRITVNNKRQATLPRGAIAIENPRGTAPGLIVEDARGIVVCMPGVPHELKGMFRDSVLPYLRTKFRLEGLLHYRELKVCGVGESRIDSLMGDLVTSQSNPTVGIRASPEAVRIRIAAKAATREAAEALIDPVEAQVRERLGHWTLAPEQETLEAAVDSLLGNKRWRLAVGETTTGGMLAQRLIAADAEHFAGGLVVGRAYAEAFEKAQPVNHAVLALSDEIMLRFSTDCALVLAGLPGQRITRAALRTPQSLEQWDIGETATGALNQTRVSVRALEGLRRHLMGHPVAD